MIYDSLSYRVPIIAGAILITPCTAQVLGERVLWHFGNSATYVLAGLTLAGTSFAWWARIHLGRFWSSAITRKEGHRVIDTGPYGLVRHPIYTGLIGAILATGDWRRGGDGDRAARRGADRLRAVAEGPHGGTLPDD
jgi:protein-S-isoprenylcysteine O-methyltransferase Ste14